MSQLTPFEILWQEVATATERVKKADGPEGMEEKVRNYLRSLFKADSLYEPVQSVMYQLRSDWLRRRVQYRTFDFYLFRHREVILAEYYPDLDWPTEDEEE